MDDPKGQHCATGNFKNTKYICRNKTLWSQAAGRIHTDFEKGFIMAEVMKFAAFKVGVIVMLLVLVDNGYRVVADFVRFRSTALKLR